MILKFLDFIAEKNNIIETEEEKIKRREEKKAKRLFYIKKLESKILSTSDLDNYDIPDKIKEMMKDWNIILKSPYSDSFYSSADVTNNYKPDGSYRVSDHWNFTSLRDDRSKKHCRTNVKVPDKTHISIGIWNDQKKLYEIILTEPKDSHIKWLNRKDSNLRYLQNSETIQKKKNFKEKVINKEVLIKLKYKGKEYEGRVKKWTGHELKIENNLGEIIYNNNYIQPDLIEYIKFTDKDNNDIPNPFEGE